MGRWITAEELRAFEAAATNAHRLFSGEGGWVKRIARDIVISYQDGDAKRPCFRRNLICHATLSGIRALSSPSQPDGWPRSLRGDPSRAADDEVRGQDCLRKILPPIPDSSSISGTVPFATGFPAAPGPFALPFVFRGTQRWAVRKTVNTIFLKIAQPRPANFVLNNLTRRLHRFLYRGILPRFRGWAVANFRRNDTIRHFAYGARFGVEHDQS
jgi:hypothetical protein